MPLLPIPDTSGDYGLFGNPMALGLLSMGSGLLANNRRGVPFGQALAGGAQGLMQGIMLGQQAQQKRREQEMMEELKKLQTQKLQFDMDEAKATRADAQSLIERIRTLQGGGAPTAAPSAVPSGGGVSDFNIGNVRPVGGGPNSGFQQPATFEDGVRLAVNNAASYPKAFNQGQPMTLLQIGERWAPKGDGANDPTQWARNVAGIGGLPVDQPLDFSNPEIKARFARGVHGAEKGASLARPVEAYSAILAGGPPQGGGEADGSGNPLPPRTAANVPAQQPRGLNLPVDLILGMKGNKQLAPLADTLLTIQNQDRTQANADRTYNFETGKWEYQKGKDAKDRDDAERRWQAEQKRIADREEFERTHQGEFVRGPDGAEVFVPRAQMGPDVRRYDKPPEPGTATGDVRVLVQGDPGSREYAAAYNRVKSQLIDGPNGLKYAPDMSAYAPPAFAQQGATLPQDQSGAPSGLSPVTAPTQKELADLRAARTEVSTIVSALEDFRKEFKSAGTRDSIRSVIGYTTPQNTAYNVAALLAKGEALFNLGVLNGPDLAIIRRTLPDPSTFTGAGTKPAEMDTAVDKIVNLLNTRMQAKESQLGIGGPPASGGSARSSAQPGAAAPSGVPVYDLNGRRVR